MKKLSLLLLLLSLSCLLFASFNWNEDYITPYCVSVTSLDNSNEIEVTISGKTGSSGADKILVSLIENNQTIEKKNLGRSKKEERKFTLSLDHSGEYTIELKATKKGEEKEYLSEYTFSYTLPLSVPSINALNLGEGALSISFDSVKEADSYTISLYSYDSNKLIREEKTESNNLTFSNLKEGVYLIEVSVHRGRETVKTPKIKKTVRKERDREWNFTYFGQSTKESLNYYKLLDSDNLSFTLYAGSKTEQGGKFTSLHDGISFYYTKIDGKNENFVLSAKITVNWINPTPDGQEGFGILALDSIGEYGVSGVNNYTNSVGLIATKFEERINGVKYSSKDTLGARFVTGLTEEIINEGEEAISENGKAVYHAYSYDEDALVKSGDVYYLTIKKDNSGYYCYYTVPEEEREWIINEDGDYERKQYPSLFTLYGPENLLQIDKDYIYLGFASARWAEITVSDISLTITDPSLDPPRREEEPDLVALTTTINSPSGYWTKSYPFAFTSNSDGTLSVKEAGSSHYYLKDEKIKANSEFKKTIELLSSSNDLYISFKPDENYSPSPNERIAQYNEEEAKYEITSQEVSFYKNVKVREIDGEYIYASPKGFGFNEGTIESPLNIESAILYSKPGQTIILLGGEYNIGQSLTIERGNSGEKDKYKTIRSIDGERAILKFSKTQEKGGVVIWGDYWRVENIDITNTPDSSKGLQIAGSYCVVSSVRAYRCGDTGIQISGSSLDSPSLWPHDNLVEYSISHDNSDKAENNADGFAAKLTVGENNVFNYCLAYSNIDDGWDLYSKAETGAIGEVTIKNCIAYSNGTLSDGSGSGDGNGFKMGGDGISVNHKLINSISFNNTSNGVTSNSNPSLTIINCTLFNNGNRNLTLYGKGSGERNYRVENLLSVGGTLSDDIKEAGDILSDNNFFSNGNVGVNKSGKRIDSSIFESIDLDNINIFFDNGTINTSGLLVEDSEYGAHF